MNMNLMVALPLLSITTIVIPLELANPGFEAGVAGWSGLASTQTNALHAPPGGVAYATAQGTDASIEQRVGGGLVVERGRNYSLTVWARAIDTSANIPTGSGVARHSVATVDLIAGSSAGGGSSGSSAVVAATVSAVVSPPRLAGAAASTPNDDGANVWVDGGYRMSAADYFLYQRLPADPLSDPWTRGNRNDLGLALTHLCTTPQGLRAIYATHYLTDSDSSPPVSRIERVDLSGSPPAYTVPPPSGTDVAGE